MHQLPKVSYKPTENCFFRNNNGTWSIESCRERMQSHFDSNQNQMDFYFCTGSKKKSENVIDFMTVVESAARVGEGDRVKIEVTTNDTVLYVLMSPWWRNRVRISLLTALLRSGQNYTERSAAGFEKALNSTPYTAQTRAAIDIFLSGRTSIKNKSVLAKNFNGWYSLFSQAGLDPSKVLTRVKRKKTDKK